MTGIAADRSVQIAGNTIGPGQPTFVIAEVGINHGGSLEKAKLLVSTAARSGANAVKFQTYTTERRVPPNSPIFDILKSCELSQQEQRELSRTAAQEGILFMSTPFDVDSVDFLANVGSCAIKIASFDCTNLELVRRAAQTGVPVIVSTGMASTADIDAAAQVLREQAAPFALLHCVSAYPTPLEALNLATIGFLRRRYGSPVGFSDHTIGTEAPFWAVLAGSQVIEKHFTLDKSAPGPDHALSADLTDMVAIVQHIRKAEQILGSAEPTLLAAEAGTVPFRRFSD